MRPTVYGGIAALLLCIPSCASAGRSSFSYVEPTPLSIDNETTTAKPFDQVWETLVAELATRFYIINNLDKASRLINVSFSSQTPERYVTGGMTTRTADEHGKEQIFSYDPAASSTYRTFGTWGVYNNLPSSITVNRLTSLDGRANIYVASTQQGGTKVSVNVRYILTVRSIVSYVNTKVVGVPLYSGKQPEEEGTSATFSTNEPYRMNWGTPSHPNWTAFRSTGLFERDVLSIVEE